MAFDWLLASRRATRVELNQVVALMRGRKGVAVLREVLLYAVHNSQSPFESYARALLIQAGLTEVATQVPVGPYSGDLGLDRLIIEVDGEEKYDGKTYRPLDITLRKERKREVYLQNRGYIVRRVDPMELLRNPDGFIAMVREALSLLG